MSYLKRLQMRYRNATKEYVPAVRVLGQLTELELGSRTYVHSYLKELGLPEMADIVKAMTDHDFGEFIRDIEDTSEDEGELH